MTIEVRAVMDILAEIFTIYAILVSLLLITVAVVGVYNFVNNNQRHQLLYGASAVHSNEGTHVGISVIVSGYGGKQAVGRWLSMDYSQFEIVVVCDFIAQPSVVELLEHYSMVRVEHVDLGELNYPAPRAMYRSREMRYMPLLLVDNPATTITSDFNCGVGVCSYGYVIAFNRWCMLHNDALHRLALEIHEQPMAQVVAVSGLRSASPDGGNMAIIDYCVRMMVLGAGLGSISGAGHYTGEIVLFERESVVKSGGYVDDFIPDIELLWRVRKLWERTLPLPLVLFTPQIMAHETGSDISAWSVIPLRYSREGVSFTSRALMVVFILITAFVLLVSLVASNYFSTLALLLIFAVGHLSTVAVGAVSLIPIRIVLQQTHSHPVGNVWLALPLYPFFVVWCLLWPKNFVKS